MSQDDLVEGPFHVEHHRVERTAARLVDAGDLAWCVVQFGQSHRLRQPASGVDGENAHSATVLGSAQGKCSGGGGLTDATRATAPDDRRRTEELVDIKRLRHVMPWSVSRPASS